jgi:hypothetical protein
MQAPVFSDFTTSFKPTPATNVCSGNITRDLALFLNRMFPMQLKPRSDAEINENYPKVWSSCGVGRKLTLIWSNGNDINDLINYARKSEGVSMELKRTGKIELFAGNGPNLVSQKIDNLLRNAKQKRTDAEQLAVSDNDVALGLISRAKFVIGYLSIGVGFLERGEIQLSQIPEHVTTGTTMVIGSGHRRLQPSTFNPVDPEEELSAYEGLGKGKRKYYLHFHPDVFTQDRRIGDLPTEQVVWMPRVVFRSLMEIRNGVVAPIRNALNPKNKYFKQEMGHLNFDYVVENGRNVAVAFHYNEFGRRPEELLAEAEAEAARREQEDRRRALGEEIEPVEAQIERHEPPALVVEEPAIGGGEQAVSGPAVREEIQQLLDIAEEEGEGGGAPLFEDVEWEEPFPPWNLEEESGDLDEDEIYWLTNRNIDESREQFEERMRRESRELPAIGGGVSVSRGPEEGAGGGELAGIPQASGKEIFENLQNLFSPGEESGLEVSRSRSSEPRASPVATRSKTKSASRPASPALTRSKTKRQPSSRQRKLRTTTRQIGENKQAQASDFVRKFLKHS